MFKFCFRNRKFRIWRLNESIFEGIAKATAEKIDEVQQSKANLQAEG
ncbi:MAG: hypothetical protein AAGE93_10425 [Bacteroidota bacterium]